MYGFAEDAKPGTGQEWKNAGNAEAGTLGLKERMRESRNKQIFVFNYRRVVRWLNLHRSRMRF